MNREYDPNNSDNEIQSNQLEENKILNSDSGISKTTEKRLPKNYDPNDSYEIKPKKPAKYDPNLSGIVPQNQKINLESKNAIKSAPNHKQIYDPNESNVEIIPKKIPKTASKQYDPNSSFDNEIPKKSGQKSSKKYDPNDSRIEKINPPKSSKYDPNESFDKNIASEKSINNKKKYDPNESSIPINENASHKSKKSSKNKKLYDPNESIPYIPIKHEKSKISEFESNNDENLVQKSKNYEYDPNETHAKIAIAVDLKVDNLDKKSKSKPKVSYDPNDSGSEEIKKQKNSEKPKSKNQSDRYFLIF